MHPRRHPRRLVAVTLAGLLLAACASGPQAASEGGGGGSAQTLEIATVTSDRPGLEAAMELFKQQHPDVEITPTYADTDQFQATLRTQLSSGTAPDVFFAWPGNGNPGAIEVIAPAGYLTDLSDRPWVEDIPEAIKPVTQVEGKTYILPVALSGIGAVYNVQAMEEIGAKPPTTWTELLAFCDTAKAKGKAAFALGNQTPWVTQLIDYALVSTLVYGENPDFDAQMAAGAATFVGSPWQTAMEKYLEMNERGCFNQDPLGTSFEASIGQVAAGDSVAVVQTLSAFGQVESQAPEGTEFGMFPLPATDDASQTFMPGAAGGSYGVNAKATNKELALEFVDFLATPEAMNAYVEPQGNLPSIPNDQFDMHPALQSFVDLYEANKTVPFMDQLWPNPKVQNTHFTGVQELFTGKKTPEDVLAEMDAAYQEGA